MIRHIAHRRPPQRSSLRSTMNPPMLTMPSFFALIVQASAWENISSAMERIAACRS
jgi:hypothetical protein